MKSNHLNESRPCVFTNNSRKDEGPVRESTRAQSNGYQGFIRKHSRILIKVDTSHVLPFCLGVNGTSTLISDHHGKSVRALPFPLKWSQR